jgi:hypothetical protein
MNNENFEFKVGDRVCIEGVLRKGSLEGNYPFVLDIDSKNCLLLTNKGEFNKDSGEVVLKLIESPKPKLTFEFIRNNLVPMKHLLVDANGDKRLYLGFNRQGNLVTDSFSKVNSVSWHESGIKDWTYEDYNE